MLHFKSLGQVQIKRHSTSHIRSQQFQWQAEWKRMGGSLSSNEEEVI